nr:hypothetical protein [Tanacetum cinerariifolium]
MWNLRRIMELRDSAQFNNWSDVLSLYFWRAKEAELRMARMINNVSVKLSAVIEEYQLFTQELKDFPGWVVIKDMSIEYFQELVQRDVEMVQRLQALEKEVEEKADEKMLFIEKLKGKFEHFVFPGLSAALEDPEEELAHEEEFEGGNSRREFLGGKCVGILDLMIQKRNKMKQKDQSRYCGTLQADGVI